MLLPWLGRPFYNNFLSSQVAMMLTKICPKCHMIQHCRSSMCKKFVYVIRKSNKTSVVTEIRADETEQACELHRTNDRQRKQRNKVTKL